MKGQLRKKSAKMFQHYSNKKQQIETIIQPLFLKFSSVGSLPRANSIE